MSELLQLEIPELPRPQRLDTILAELCPQFSRSRLQLWIKQGKVTLNGAPSRAKEKVYGSEKIEILAEEIVVEDGCEPEDIPIDIIYEDEDLIVINKPAGLVVHPGAGNRWGTLQNALLFYNADLQAVPRAGIVHRLDKDTSGLMVVAKNLMAHKSLVEQLQERSVYRRYDAVVLGNVISGATVDLPIGRHKTDRLRMAVNEDDGRDSITHYRVREKFRIHTHIRCQLESGRTHQIRVHMSHIGYPLVGDQLYGDRVRLPKGASAEVVETLRGFKRQALCASTLGLVHPGSGEDMQWSIDLPEDMLQLLSMLRDDHEENLSYEQPK